MRLHVEAERKKFQEDQRFKAFFEEKRKNIAAEEKRKIEAELKKAAEAEAEGSGLQLKQRGRMQKQTGLLRRGLRRKEERKGKGRRMEKALQPQPG